MPVYRERLDLAAGWIGVHHQRHLVANRLRIACNLRNHVGDDAYLEQPRAKHILIVEQQPQDVGSLTNELYMPDRVVPYIQAALSHKLAMQLPGVDFARVQYLEKLALDARTQFEEEDRDKSPIYFQPNISYYTR